MLMNSLEAVDWTPLAVVAIAGGMDWSAVENGWWQGEYLMTPTPWTQDNPVVRDSWSANPRMPACGRTSTQCNNWLQLLVIIIRVATGCLTVFVGCRYRSGGRLLSHDVNAVLQRAQEALF